MSVASFNMGSWLSGVTQLLEEHHLAVLSDDGGLRAAFAGTMAGHLRGFPNSQVAVIDGRKAKDLASFTDALIAGMRSSGNEPVNNAGDVGELSTLIELLRSSPDGVRHRYVLWTDADEMLEKDVLVFSRIVNALLSSAAEHEYLSPEPLILQRTLFLGGDKLGAYCEDERGQFSRWLPDGQTPFEDVETAMTRPKVLTYRIDG